MRGEPDDCNDGQVKRRASRGNDASLQPSCRYGLELHSVIAYPAYLPTGPTTELAWTLDRILPSASARFSWICARASSGRVGSESTFLISPFKFSRLCWTVPASSSPARS